MFRRHWSGLPKDASFPDNLEGLGYFINDQDEIRSVEKPDYYFKFFTDRNMRINERQRFAFNMAMERIVHERLENEGLIKMTVPLRASPDEKHSPIFATPDLASCSRVVVVFGEPTQDLGLLAGRIANGPGGLNKGSMVSVVQEIRKQVASPGDAFPPAVVLANLGQRFWWPEGKRALTLSASGDTPMPSLVHSGTRYVASLNQIPGSESAQHHVSTIFTEVVGGLASSKAKIDVVAVGDACEVVEKHFDNTENWDAVGERLSSILFFGTIFETSQLANQAFKKFLAQRARGYLLSGEPLDTPLAPPEGNPTLAIEPLGCPCYSSSEALYSELIAIRALGPALAYLQDNAMHPSIVNSPIVVTERPKEEFTEQEWSELPDEQRPVVITAAHEDMKTAVKDLRRWKRFEETGEAPESDSEEDDDKDDFLLRGNPQVEADHW